MERVLVFCPNLIGDTVMATPTFRALRLGLPDARIVAVVRPGVAPTLDGSPWFDDRILFDHKSKDPARRMPAAVRRMRAEHPTLAVLFPNSFRSALAALLSGARRRVGYGRGGRSILLTDRLKAPLAADGTYKPVPIIGYYAELAKAIGLPVPSLRTELFTTERDETAADEAFRNLGIPRGARVVCLNNGGAFGPAKSWPNAYFAEVARRLAVERDVHVLMLCGPSERDSAREVVALANHPRVASLADQTMSIGLSKACVRRSSLLISTDSGPRHFATAFDLPVVSLYGPTHIEWTRTEHPAAVDLSIPVDCGPCQRGVCSEGHHRCMRELRPDAVLAAAYRFLPPTPHVKTNPDLPILHAPNL